MAETNIANRIELLSTLLEEQGVDVFFAHSPITMRYLSGFAEGSGERFLTLAVRANGEARLICPALSEQQARRCGIEDVRPWRDGEPPLAHFEQLAKDWGLRSAICAVDDEMPARQLLEMQSSLPAALFKPGSACVAPLMRYKSSAELATMRRAGEIADDALAAGLAAIRPGATERDVALALSEAMRASGATPNFAIVATGGNGAEPHHLSDFSKIEQGDVIVMDFGCDLDGYQSDITRMACCGRASEEQHRVYDIVLAAHKSARAAIRPGVAAGAVDSAARTAIEKAGYGEFFIHRTGHGIGMRVHEEPYIIGGSEVALQVGDCFSVEPGIYLPGRFGVRIENIVAVTEDGHESLNSEPAEKLIEVR